VNDLWNLLIERTIVDPTNAWPETFYRVYDAFDAGEYSLRSDGSHSNDPVSEFTDPAIAGIIATLKRQDSGEKGNGENDP